MSWSIGRRRGLAAGAAVTATVAVGALLAPTATAAPELSDPADWAPAASAPIRPGVGLVTGNAACTANFIYTDGDRTFIGYAAHCAANGGASDLDGCETEAMPLGTPVAILATDGTERAGTLAYTAWGTMAEVGEDDPDTCFYNDFALVEIDPADVAEVNPSMPVFGGPTGVDTDGLPVGEQVFSFGNSPTRSGIAELMPKTGISAGDVGGGFAHTYYSVTPDVPGDSGNGVLDSEGQAVGSLSRLNIVSTDELPGSTGATDIARAMAYAQEFGGLGGLTLVPGTEGFTPSGPAGLPLPPLAIPAGPPTEG